MAEGVDHQAVAAAGFFVVLLAGLVGAVLAVVGGLLVRKRRVLGWSIGGTGILGPLLLGLIFTAWSLVRFALAASSEPWSECIRLAMTPTYTGLGSLCFCFGLFAASWWFVFYHSDDFGKTKPRENPADPE